MKASYIKHSIAILEARRAILNDSDVDIALKVLRQILANQDNLSMVISESKQLTVLYATLHGWTAFSDALADEENHYILDRLWQRIDAVVTNHKGTVVTHLGHSLVALFGADDKNQNDAGEAIQSALKIKQSLSAFLMEWADAQPQKMALPNLKFSIALHAGYVFWRQSDDGDAKELLGDAINIVQRLNYHTDAGQILISQNIYQKMRGVFYIQQRKPLTLTKDGSQNLNTYEVKGAKPYAVRVINHSVEGVETSMVGRDAELSAMQSAFQTVVTEGHGKFIMLSGAAGIGKSRLLYEFDNWLEKQPRRIHFLQGRSSVQTSQLPFWVWRDIFAFYAEIFASDSTSLTEQKLSQAIGSIVGTNADEMASYIGHLLGWTTLPSAITTDDTQDIRGKAERAMAQFFEALVADGVPMVLILEDIHWADSASMQILQRLWHSLRNSPVLIICSVQSKLFESFSTWMADDARVEKLSLPALSDTASAKLIEQILQKIPTLPKKLRAMLIEKALGHPLLIEELVQLLIDQDVILPLPTRWQIDKDALNAMDDLPSALEDVLTARLAIIPMLEREMLQRASAIGRAFWNVALAQISDATTQQMGLEIIDLVLESLQERALILKRESSPFAKTREYIFKHNFLRDIVYQSLPLHRLSAYHTQIAAWLIEHNGEQVDAYAALIAAHYRAANIPIVAAEWFFRAGEQAQHVFAWSVAVNHYKTAMDLMENNQHTSSKAQNLWLQILSGLASALGHQAEIATNADEAAQLFSRTIHFAEIADDVELNKYWLNRCLKFEKAQNNQAQIDLISAQLRQLST